MTDAVPTAHRFTKRNPCPVCGGGHNLPSGQGIRCYGFLSSDERYAHCTREEHAHGLLQESGGTFAHRLDGPCNFGQMHGAVDFFRNDRERSPNRYEIKLGQQMTVKPQVTRNPGRMSTSAPTGTSKSGRTTG